MTRIWAREQPTVRGSVLGKLEGGSTRLPRVCHWLCWMPAHSVYCKPAAVVVVVVAAGGDDDGHDNDQAYGV